MQEIWRSLELPAPLETNLLVQQNLSTRSELEAWVEAQKTRILEEKRADQLQAQEHARATNEAQRKREVLQIEHQRLSTGAVLCFYIAVSILCYSTNKVMGRLLLWLLYLLM